MHRMAFLSVVALILFTGCASFTSQDLVSTASLRPAALRCEGRENPLGIDSATPGMSWRLAATRPGARGLAQTAYRILAATSPDRLVEGAADLWDSGRIDSDRQTDVPCRVPSLESGRRYWWTVRIWDHAGRASRYAEPAWWETGLSLPEPWAPNWITGARNEPATDADRYRDDPAPRFRKAFQVDGGVRSARLYLCGLGHHEARINGMRVGDRFLDPGWTGYGKRVLYAAYDVTALLRGGEENVLAVTLGKGWYDPLPLRMWGRINLREHLTVGRPRLAAELRVTYRDGTMRRIVTDGTWKTADSPLLRNNLYLGEVHDARLETPGWDRPGFDDGAWTPARPADPPGGVLKAQSHPPVRVREVLRPRAVTEPKPGIFVFDMGRVLAGWARLKAGGPRGTTVRMRFGELLHDDGTVNGHTAMCGQIKGPGTGGPGAPDRAWQEDTYILRGEGIETWAPRFTFHSFRYVEVSGLPGRPGPDTLQGVALCADVKPIGRFACSDPLLNRIETMTLNTFTSNLFSVQSDCPGREKFGYGGDIVTACDAFLFHFDMERFYIKAVRDFLDAQRPGGGFTETAPHVGVSDGAFGDRTGPPGWVLAPALLLDRLHRFRGVRSIADEAFPPCLEALAFLDGKAGEGLLGGGIGDHESLAKKPMAFTSPLFHWLNTGYLARTARRLKRDGEAARLEARARGILERMTEAFLDPSTGTIHTGTQACQALALFHGLVPEAIRDKAAARLLEAVAGRDGHLDTGIFGTEALLPALTAAGRADLALSLVRKREFPGWGHMLEGGATTLWEHWAFSDNTFSHNHPMFGSVMAWFFRGLAGIYPADEAEALDRIVVEPAFVEGLDWVEAIHDGPRGRIVSRWRRTDAGMRLDVDVPPNTEAEIRITAPEAANFLESGLAPAEAPGVIEVRREKDLRVLRVGSGRYRFIMTTPGTGEGRADEDDD